MIDARFEIVEVCFGILNRKMALSQKEIKKKKARTGSGKHTSSAFLKGEQKSPACFENISLMVGNTPLVKLSRVNENPNVTIWGKLESKNPGGSVKDRPAKYMFEGAEKSGKLHPGIQLIEPTAGNTGIALAMIAASKGYKIELAMPESASKERVKTMAAYGAKVTLTPAARQMEGAIDYVREKIAKHKDTYYMFDQFSNFDNVRAHYEGTGHEIWRDTNGSITHFVSAMGTTGTIMGVSKYLREKNPNIKIVGAQPTEGSSIPGIRRWPKEYLPKIYDSSCVDQLMNVSESTANAMARRVAREEGILCGVSAGGAISLACEVAKKMDKGVIVCIICDGGERYLSTDLFC